LDLKTNKNDEVTKKQTKGRKEHTAKKEIITKQREEKPSKI